MSTANAIVGAKENYLQEGFDAFLEKPIDFKKLEDLIEELLDDSLLQEVTRTSEQSAGTESGMDISEFPLVEGLDWKYASIHFNDEQAMLETVQFFVSALDYDANELEKLFADIQTEEGRISYCTKVHSMKNSAATIGIIPLAGMAKVLEDAAKNAEIAVLEALTPIFIERWRAYKGKLSSFAGVSENTNRKPADDFQEEVSQLLHRIKTAAEDMDIDELDRLKEQLEEYQFDGIHKENIEKIHMAIANFDVEFLQGLAI